MSYVEKYIRKMKYEMLSEQKKQDKKEQRIEAEKNLFKRYIKADGKNSKDSPNYGLDEYAIYCSLVEEFYRHARLYVGLKTLMPGRYFGKRAEDYIHDHELLDFITFIVSLCAIFLCFAGGTFFSSTHWGFATYFVVGLLVMSIFWISTTLIKIGIGDFKYRKDMRIAAECLVACKILEDKNPDFRKRICDTDDEDDDATDDDRCPYNLLLTEAVDEIVKCV